MPDLLRTRALGLLSRREHSRMELQRKLAPHAETPEQLENLLKELADTRLLSDVRYAEMRINVRSNRYGNTRLAQELRQAGVTEENINNALASSQDEISRCQTVWQKKFAILPESPAEQAKQQRFLQYRGFSTETIRRVLRDRNHIDE